MRYRNAILGLTIFVLLTGLVIYSSDSVRFVRALHSRNEAGKRQILYHVNHAELAEEMRKFAEQKRGETSITDVAHLVIWDSDPDFPPSLRILKCSSVTVLPDRVRLEFGGPFLHFGIFVFDRGHPGEGTKRLADGVWFYSEDGRVPSN
jgi:hypothetical protein